MKDNAIKVLALPFGEYYNSCKKVLLEGKNKLGWDIRCIASSDDFKPYQEIVRSKDDLYVPPDLLSKQEWEADSKLRQDLETFIEKSEEIAGVPFSRILLSCERDIGRAYSKRDYYWPERKISRRILKDKKLIYDVLFRAFKFARDVFEDFQPDLCMGGPTCGSENAVLYFVAKYFGIPHVTCMTSGVRSNAHYWSTSWGSYYNDDLQAEFDRREARSEPPSPQALEYVKKFREAPKALPHYEKMWRDQGRSISFINVTKRVLKVFLHRIVPLLKGKKLIKVKPVFITALYSYRMYFLKKFQNKFYSIFSNKKLSTFKYIYYPFHQDPEFVLNVRAPFWYNQKNTIKMLSYNLPLGYKLLVREHRHNIGRRSNKFLREISRYPGVTLVSAYGDQYRYIKNASLVVTVNGTTGFEGVLMKKPVLALDKTFYDPLNLTLSISENRSFGSLILNAVKQQQRFPENFEERIARFIDSEREIAFDSNDEAIKEIQYIYKILNMQTSKELVEA